MTQDRGNRIATDAEHYSTDAVLKPMALMWRKNRRDAEREVRHLLAEIADLRRDNEDLRDAARSWRRLYERAIEREPNRRLMHLAGTTHRP